MADLHVVSQAGPAEADEADGADALSAREQRFVDAIAGGASLADGATAAGVSYRTAKRWHRKGDIQAAIKAQVSASLSQARATLASGSARAASRLVAMADGSAEPTAPRVSAARAVVESAVKLSEVLDLEERLTALETRLATNTNAPTFSRRTSS